MSNPFDNNIATPIDLSPEAFEETLRILRQPYAIPPPPQLIVSPEVMRLIETDPVWRKAAELALGRKLKL